MQNFTHNYYKACVKNILLQKIKRVRDRTDQKMPLSLSTMQSCDPLNHHLSLYLILSAVLLIPLKRDGNLPVYSGSLHTPVQCHLTSSWEVSILDGCYSMLAIFKVSKFSMRSPSSEILGGYILGDLRIEVSNISRFLTPPIFHFPD